MTSFTTKSNFLFEPQVIRKFQMVAENNSYFLNVGTKVDVAFICMCAFAIDELFSDD